MKTLLVIIVLLFAAKSWSSDCSSLVRKIVIQEHTEEGLIGELIVHTDGLEMYVDHIKVADGHKRQGVSKRLFRRLFSRNQYVEKVEAYLVFDNNPLDQLDSAYRVSQVECFEALAKSPFYKAMSTYGFIASECKSKMFNGAIKVTFLRW